MDIERFCIKFFARPESRIDDAILIDIFHEWIRHKQLGGILLDVADYRHVPDGPGVMLITHEINFGLDYSNGRFGLLAQRKLGLDQNVQNHQERILELVRATVAFGALLEADARVAGQLNLEAGAFQYQANDRLAAPNDDDAFAALRPDLQAAAGLIYPGRPVTISRVRNDPRDRLTVDIDSGTSLTMAALLEAAGVAA